MKSSPKRIFIAALIAAASIVESNLQPVCAEPVPAAADASKADTSQADPALAQEIADMRAKAALLQGTLAQNTTPMPKMAT